MPSDLEAILAAPKDDSVGLHAVADAIAQAAAEALGCHAGEIWLWRVGAPEDRRIERVGRFGPVPKFNALAGLFVDWPYEGPWSRSIGEAGTEAIHLALGSFGFATVYRDPAAPEITDAMLARITALCDRVGHRLVAELPPSELESNVRWLLVKNDFDRRAARLLAGARSLEELGRLIDAMSSRLFKVEYSGIYFVEPGTSRLRLVFGRGLTELERQNAERTADQRHPGEVVRSGRAVDLEEISPAAAGEEPPGHGHAIRSRLYLPVRSGDAVVGTIGFASAQPRSFGRRHHQALSFLADLAGVMYARLHAQREIERRGQLIESCAVANERLIASTDWRAAATPALALVGAALGARALALVRLDPDEHGKEEDFIWQPMFGAPWPHQVRAKQVTNEEVDQLARGQAIEWHEPGATLVVKPLSVDGELWGMIVCEPAESAPRSMSRIERAALRALAGGFAAAIARERTDRDLRDRQRQDAVSRLASGIAHDFNNLLWPILLYSDMLERAPGMDERTRHMLRDMRGSAARASELVQQMFAISRTRDRVLEVVDVGEITVEIAATVRRSAPTSARISAAIDPETGHVLGDEASIRELIMQVFAHALEALEGQEGEIRIVLERIERDRGSWLRLAITDTGSMPRARQLALTAAHRIASEHRGELTVMGLPSGGTQRELFLPISLREPIGTDEQPTVEQLEAEIKAAEESTLTGERILLVDDDAAVLEVAKQILESLGYEVIAQSRAQDAVNLLGRTDERFSLLLTDVAMPGMDGLSLAREAKRLRPGIPVVCCTGFGDARAERTAAEIGVSAFIRKPIDFDHYAKTIRAAIDGSLRE
jgi:CheY-like chemotaxis protein